MLNVLPRSSASGEVEDRDSIGMIKPRYNNTVKAMAIVVFPYLRILSHPPSLLSLRLQDIFKFLCWLDKGADG